MGEGPDTESERLKMVLKTDLSKITRKDDRKEVDKVVSTMEAKGISTQRQIDFVWLMWKFSMVDKRSLLARKTEEVIKYLNSLKLSPRTQNLYRGMFLHMYGKDFMATVPKNNGAKPTYSNDELLTREEMYKVVESALTHQHRALLGILADSGARKQELRDIRKQDIVSNSMGEMSVILTTAKLRGGDKEKTREVPIFEAAPYIRAYINSLPSDFPESGKLFDVADRTVNFIINRAAKRAGIPDSKAFNPHAWRHARLTQLSKFVSNNEELARLAGWTRGSDMAGIYIHTTSQEAGQNVRAKMTGAPVEQPKPVISNCPRCKVAVPPNIKFCNDCGAPVDVVEFERVRVQDTVKGDAMAVLDEVKNQLQKSKKEQSMILRLVLAMAKNPDLARRLKEYRTMEKWLEQVEQGLEEEEIEPPEELNEIVGN